MKTTNCPAQELEWANNQRSMTWKSAVLTVCEMNGVPLLSDVQLSWYNELDEEVKFGKHERPWRLPTTKELKEAFDKKVPGFERGEYWSSHGAWPYPGKLAVDMSFGGEVLKEVGFWGDVCRVRLVR